MPPQLRYETDLCEIDPKLHLNVLKELYSCPVVQHVVLHGDVSHTRAHWGADADMQWQGLGEAISFTTNQGHYILVDAGEKGSALGRKFRGPVDVLLLTHNDRDHVGGVPELLRSMLVHEAWLPYDWYLLYSAGTNLVEAIRREDADLEDVAYEALERVTSAVEMLRRYLEDGECLDELNDSPPARRRVLGWLDAAFASLNSGIGAEVVIRAQHAIGLGWIGGAGQTAQGVTGDGAPSRRARVTRARATVRAVDAVLGWEVPTRWFSIDLASAYRRTTDLPWELSGRPGEFTVVNAWPVPVRPLPPSPTAADAYALLAALYQLTIQNRRALVGLGHTPFECGHVLFASDSDFKFDQANSVVPWSKIGAAVGLHHGSANEAHDHIYERLDGAVLARSGSCPVLWTHSRFTLLPPERRGCTWCHADGVKTGGLDRHRDVVLEASQNGEWRVVAGACTGCPRFAWPTSPAKVDE